MLSGYGKDGIQNYIAKAKTENRILYAQKNSQKNKANPSVQFADILLSSDYTTNLAEFQKIVNKKFQGTIFENSRLPKMRFSREFVQAQMTEQDWTNLWALLNKSFTKGLTPNANNAVVVESIFDVFADQMSETAEYNAFALPLVDAMKWFNYREREKPESIGNNGKQSMSREFGKNNSIAKTEDGTNDGRKEETREAFYRRAHEKAYTVRERGQIAFGYAPVTVQTGSAGRTEKALQEFGIPVVIHEGLEANVNGVTSVILGDAATVTGDAVYGN